MYYCKPCGIKVDLSLATKASAGICDICGDYGSSLFFSNEETIVKKLKGEKEHDRRNEQQRKGGNAGGDILCTSQKEEAGQGIEGSQTNGKDSRVHKGIPDNENVLPGNEGQGPSAVGIAPGPMALSNGHSDPEVTETASKPKVYGTKPFHHDIHIDEIVNETVEGLAESFARRLAFHRFKFDRLTKHILNDHDLAFRNTVFDKMSVHLAEMEKKTMKTAKKTMVIVLITLMAVTGLPGALMAKNATTGMNTPLKGLKTSSVPVLDAFCVLELAQNTESPESGPTEAEIVENCCPDADACQAEIERLRRDPPEIPAKSWLMGLQWFRDLDPTAQTIIGSVLTAAVAGLFTYLGTLAK